MSTAEAGARPIRSLIPARLDRLSWSPFHTWMVCGLGGAWILDGLQITVASSVVNAAGKSLEQVTKPLTSVSGKDTVPATTAIPTAPARPATA